MKLIDHLEAFNITAILGFENKEVDSLATITSILSLLEYFEINRFYVQLLLGLLFLTISQIGEYLKVINKTLIFNK